uniref:Poliovirus receptor n=1 Tax=Peromyscus maniculatus bairdii TaxID=230844 RepID=A0A8C8TQG7_PERMB
MDRRTLPAGLYLLWLRLLLLSPGGPHPTPPRSTTLVCSLTPTENEITVTQVTWMKKNQDGSRSTVAVFHPKKGPSITDPERVQFLASTLDRDSRNASLAMSHLRAEDEGVYECQFATFPSGSKSASISLKVLARPTTTAEALKPAPTLKLQEVAKCISTGGRPAPRIHWLSNLNGSIHETREPGPQQGTYTVTSVFSLVPSSQADGKNITCRVDHESFSEPDLQTVTLSLPYPPEVSISGYDNNWYVGRTDVALTCDARSKPEPSIYEWSTSTGPLPNTTEAWGSRLLIATVDMNTMHNVTFICNATNPLGSGQNQITVLVTGEMSSDQEARVEQDGPQGWIWGCVVEMIAGHRSQISSAQYSSVSNGNCTADIEMNHVTR